MYAFEFLSGTSNFLFNTLCLILDLSFFIGQALVNQILNIIGLTSRFVALILTFLQVLYEDTIIFLQDLTEKFSYCTEVLENSVLQLRDGIINFCYTVALVTGAIPNFFYDIVIGIQFGILSFWNVFKDFIVLIWKTLLLIGSIFWSVVAGIPRGISYCTMMLIKLFQLMHNGILTLLLTIKNFFIDIIQNIFYFFINLPYSSVLGFILTTLIFLSFLKNYRTVCAVTLQTFVIFFSYLSSLCCNLWPGNFLSRRVFLTQSERRHVQNQSYNFHANITEDKLCVICQDRLKEIILLPCRHVCLCLECWPHIMVNHKFCPICRSDIHTTMQVYI